jgi:hypothetical protein
MTSEKNPSAPQKVPAEQPKGDRSKGSGRSSDFVIFILELLIPVVLTSALIYWVSGILGIWNLNRTLALVIITIALVVFSLFISITLDGFTLPMRQKSDAGRIFNRANSRARLVKFILGGLVIPIAVFAAANLVSLPTHETAISILMRPRSLTPKAPLVVAIGNTIINSTNSSTKVQGIKTLQTFPATDSLAQLFRVLTDDPAALSDASEYEALSKAIASYGLEAKPQLLTAFNQVDPTQRKGYSTPSGDPFDRYFSASFEGLRKEIGDLTTDQAVKEANLARIDSVEADLKVGLSKMAAEPVSAGSGAPLLDFVMDTFLEMNVKQEPELLLLAKKTATDATYAESTRGQALLLIAKLGGKDEINGLYSFMEEPSDLVQAKALEAIALLETKEAPPAKSK